MNRSTRSLTRAAVIAALYVLLTLLFQPISFGAVQLRISEALMLLPIVTANAVPGLFIGCLLANLLCGGVWFDVALGSFATLLAAMAVRSLRDRPAIAAALPALFNGLVVGPVVYWAYVEGTGLWVLLASMGAVALGELAVCYTLGMALLHSMQRLPQRYLGV